MPSEPVLIVDDNPQNLKLARLLLTAEGYDARTAVDAEHALSLMETFKPRLILMDIQLPGMDGLELLPSAVAGYLQAVGVAGG
jgi:CheY-like chemotaxis protein